MRRLKYEIDAKSLEIIYTTGIPSILEYADVIWDNCSHYKKSRNSKIQIEAARISTGATKLISLVTFTMRSVARLLKRGRISHKLILFYKIYNNNLTPDYFSSLFPPLVNKLSRYNLRNANDVQTINTRSALYFNSFLPFAIREWNNISDNDKYVDSVDSFK